MLIKLAHKIGAKSTVNSYVNISINKRNIPEKHLVTVFDQQYSTPLLRLFQTCATATVAGYVYFTALSVFGSPVRSDWVGDMSTATLLQMVSLP